MSTEAKWTAENITVGRLNAMTHLVATTAQRDASTAWPTSMLLWDTDLNQMFYNSGTEAVPVASKVTGADQLPVHPHSTTLGDYTEIIAATATSQTSTTTADAIDDYLTNKGYTKWGSGYEAGVSSVLEAYYQGDNVRNQTYIQTTDADYLGANLSDTAFAIRLKFKISAKSKGTGTAILIAFSDSNGSQTFAGHDYIGFAWDQFSAIAEGFGGIDGASEDLDIQVAQQKENNNSEVDKWYWLKFIRKTATTFSIGIFTDEALTAQVGTTRDCTSAATVNIKWIQFYEREATLTGTLDYEVDEIAINNGSTTVPTGTFDSVTHVRDRQTGFRWKSASEVAPAVYVDMGSAQDMSGVVFYAHSDTDVTEIKIRASTDTTFTDAENVRTIKWADITEGAYNYVRFNRLSEDRRYLQIIGTDGGSKSLALADIRVIIPNAESWLRTHGHLSISTSQTGLALDGT